MLHTAHIQHKYTDPNFNMAQCYQFDLAILHSTLNDAVKRDYSK